MIHHPFCIFIKDSEKQKKIEYDKLIKEYLQSQY